jgi:hypothetical protein
MGRRSLKRWDDRKCWWIDLPEPICRKASVETGDRVKLSLRIAPEDLPEELSKLIAKDPAARARWEKLTTGQKKNAARGDNGCKTIKHARAPRGENPLGKVSGFRPSACESWQAMPALGTAQ